MKPWFSDSENFMNYEGVNFGYKGSDNNEVFWFL
jgi:hypothetical protein